MYSRCVGKHGGTGIRTVSSQPEGFLSYSCEDAEKTCGWINDPMTPDNRLHHGKNIPPTFHLQERFKHKLEHK